MSGISGGSYSSHPEEENAFVEDILLLENNRNSSHSFDLNSGSV